jgi:hypothetical protein
MQGESLERDERVHDDDQLVITEELDEHCPPLDLGIVALSCWGDDTVVLGHPTGYDVSRRR